MKLTIVTMALAFGIFQCDNRVVCPVEPCGERAVVRDLTGKLDGCGWVIELSDGRKVIPEQRVYTQAPTKDEDPLYHFTLVDGEEVYVSYITMEGGVDSCMTGPHVFVTCIQRVNEVVE